MCKLFDSFFLFSETDTRQIVFRLAPTYSLYLMARYQASTLFRPELNPMERAQRLTLTLSRVGAMMQAIVKEALRRPALAGLLDGQRL